MRRPEVERMRALLVEAITTLCRSGLQYNANLKVEGLIGITLDEADIILVNLNKTFGSVTDPDLSPTKSLRDPDKSAVYEDSVSDSSFCQEPESPRHNSQDRKRRTDLASRKQAKKARMSPTREHAGNDSEANKQLNIANTFSLSSPEKVEASSESRVGEQDSIPSASSAESALTVPTRTEQQPQSSIEKDSTPKKISRGHDRPIVKIEIDSDPEVEEVKVEPGPLQTFSAAPPGGQLQTGTEMLPQSTFTSDLSLSQTLPSVSSADYQGEVLLSQLPPEFAAVTGGQSDSNPVPVGMFSNARAPMPGPSGLSQTVTGATPYVQTDLANPVDASGQKNKLSVKKQSVNFTVGYSSGPSLVSQTDTHLEKGMYTCQFCDKTFRSRTGKIRHEGAHEGNFRHICPICQKGFMHVNNFRKHQSMHENRKAFKCHLCQKGFNWQYSRNAHEKRCKGPFVPRE